MKGLMGQLRDLVFIMFSQFFPIVLQERIKNFATVFDCKRKMYHQPVTYNLQSIASNVNIIGRKLNFDHSDVGHFEPESCIKN